jgi:hypothetical protein
MRGCTPGVGSLPRLGSLPGLGSAPGSRGVLGGRMPRCGRPEAGNLLGIEGLGGAVGGSRMMSDRRSPRGDRARRHSAGGGTAGDRKRGARKHCHGDRAARLRGAGETGNAPQGCSFPRFPVARLGAEPCRRVSLGWRCMPGTHTHDCIACVQVSSARPALTSRGCDGPGAGQAREYVSGEDRAPGRGSHV